MDPLSELQDDLTLDDPSQALNQLKLASIDEKNWPSDEMPDFPKSGGQPHVSSSCDTTEGRPLPAGRDSRGEGWGKESSPRVWPGMQASLEAGQRGRVTGRVLG